MKINNNMKSYIEAISICNNLRKRVLYISELKKHEIYEELKEYLQVPIMSNNVLIDILMKEIIKDMIKD